jgi:TPR repeat protein
MSEIDADLETLVINAERAVKQGNIQELIDIYQQMDKLGAWRATARIGELYETGFANADKVFEKNLDEAAKWYRKSIFESDDPIAHLGLGRIYYDGSTFIDRNIHLARLHLQKAFNNELPQAGVYLGIMSMFGEGVEVNILDAEKFFLKAANSGFPIAYRYLANIAAKSGNFFRASGMIIREFILIVRLKFQDRNHPNLWRISRCNGNPPIFRAR